MALRREFFKHQNLVFLRFKLAIFCTTILLSLNIVGISHHVGSGDKCAESHLTALQLARSKFDMTF